MKGFLTIVAMCIVLFSSSCAGSDNKANILPPEIQYAADTMFNHRRNKIIEEVNDLCAENDSIVIRAMVDSLVALETEGINAIIGER